MGGSGATTTKTKQAPPQLPEELKPGVKAGSGFFRGVIANPPIFPGGVESRLAPETSTQREAIAQGQRIFGRPSAVQTAAENEIARTASGDFLLGPGAQAAVGSLSQPIFQQFRTDVIPSLRDRAIASGQGVTGTRGDIAQNEAVERFARDLATAAIAPIYTQERALQAQAAGQAPAADLSEALRIQNLASTGAQERQFAQEPLDIQQQIFNQGVGEQSAAASTLLGTANFGPGNSKTTAQQTLSTGQQIMQWVQTLALVAAAVRSSRKLKTDIVSVPNSDNIVNKMLDSPVYKWRYKWDDKSHIGPMLEDLPEILYETSETIDVVSYLGALLLTVQKQNERITNLENQLSSSLK